MTLCVLLIRLVSSCRLFLTCVPQTNPPPSGSCEKRAAMMIAWRVSPPACLPVVDLPLLPRRCRLVGRNGERGVFIPGSVMAICPVLVSPCVSFLISSGVSLRSSCLRCVFLVYFSPRSREACDCSICSRARLVRRLVVPSRHASRAAAASSCACLMRSRWRLLVSFISSRRAGRGAGRSGEVS